MIRSEPFLSHEMREKVSVFIFDTRMENGVVLSSGYSIIFCCYSAVVISFFQVFTSCFTRLNLTIKAVTKNQRTTIVFGEDF